MNHAILRPSVLCFLSILFAAVPALADPPVDFGRDVRPILSNHCFRCHGPDATERKAGLRLDTAEGARRDLGEGRAAVVPGRSAESELIVRVTSTDDDDRMPPGKGAELSAADIATLRRWIDAGAPFAAHWSYAPPVRPVVPPQGSDWAHTPVDRFVARRLEAEGLTPAPEADRAALARRVSLDLTGLPPTVERLEEFLADVRPDAYERYVDRLCADPAFGEHWARKWLDLARYADSAGYADDPPRTIWGYRDWVIRALNEKMPFDRFTIEQLAGDLLPEPTTSQLVATAFHRNTLTNNEGGTNDEEFRSVAIVDRVNTTMQVWMGTTIECAQCHNHKYDPISQEEFFRLYAILDSTEDADRRDESPTVPLWTDETLRRKAALEREIAELERTLATPTPALAVAEAAWRDRLAAPASWREARPLSVRSENGAVLAVADDASITVESPHPTDTYVIDLPLDAPVTGLRLETPANAGSAGGNFVITRIAARVVPRTDAVGTDGRFVRIDLPGPERILSLAEVQVFTASGENVARSGKARQRSTDYGGDARRAVDGETNGDWEASSVTHTATGADPWWEVELPADVRIERVLVWNRTDNALQSRLAGARVSILDSSREPVWTHELVEAPTSHAEISVTGAREVRFANAWADHSQDGFPASSVTAASSSPDAGWAVAPRQAEPHRLTIAAATALTPEADARLEIRIEQRSKHAGHTLRRFALSVTGDAAVSDRAGVPEDIAALLLRDDASRTAEDRARITRHFLAVAPVLDPERQRLEAVRDTLAKLAPDTTVPVLRELPADKKRTTRIQRRGNFLDTGDEVAPGLPSALHPLPEGAAADRMGLARWLVDPHNPLSPRVVANRHWEAIFGVGLVRTSEEFGSQGELPSHPELLDWLASTLVDSGWDVAALVRLLVISSAYRQSSRVSPELWERDPDNRLLARGPRFRLSAETIRDQSLAVAGLLSRRLYGPPVKPPQPSLGLSAAFGSGIDWQTSEGADRYRRGLYTTWRRSNPYPSMAAFDAPNREVCILRRDRTNTPLQALVTLNDPVYIEAAQGLARRVVANGGPAEAKIRFAFLTALSRPPGDEELARIVRLHAELREEYGQRPEAAMAMATQPFGAAPPGSDLADLAAWTVVSNVLLNLDEMFLKR